MKVLITGSSGFMGKHLVQYLIAQGMVVGGIDIREIKEKDGQPPFFFRKCNLLNKDELIHSFNEFMPDNLIHLAGRTDLREKRNIRGYAANIDGTQNVILAVRNTPSIKRAIFTSTQLVCKIGYVPKNETDYLPSSLYGKSKALAEEIIRDNDGGGAEWCIVRPTTVWGPGMNAHYLRFFTFIKKGVYFHVGNRPLYKSYGFIKNIVHQYFKLIEAPAAKIHRKMFYLADYEPISLRAWTDAFQEGLKAKKIKSYPEPLVKFFAKAGDLINLFGPDIFPFNSFRLNNILTEYKFDLSKTEEVCGDLPYSMNDGIKETLEWLQKEIFQKE